MELSVFYNLEVVKMKEKEIQYPDFVVRENIKVENYGYDNERTCLLCCLYFDFRKGRAKPEREKYERYRLVL